MPSLCDFSGISALIVGDAMLDIYTQGTSERMMPEAASAPVIVAESSDLTLGGAANVATNAVSLGAKVDFLCLTGDDDGRGQMLALASRLGLKTQGFIVDGSRPTITKERIILDGQHVARIDREKTHDVDGPAKEALMTHYRHCLNHAQVVILSDYCKGCLSDDVIREMIALADKKQIPVLADSKKNNVGAFAGALCLKPNLKELEQRTNMAVDQPNKIEAAARHLMEISGIQHIIASRSENGAMLVGETGTHIYNANVRQVREVSGAGDTLLATAALCVAAGMALPEAVRVGNVAAGAAVEKHGTSALTHEELTNAVLRYENEMSAA